LLSGVAGGIAGGMIGLLCSQFLPIFGGWLAVIAEPFSKMRLSLIPIHLLVMVPFGAICGAGLAWLVTNSIVKH
jgi:hypothetical protein